MRQISDYFRLASNRLRDGSNGLRVGSNGLRAGSDRFRSASKFISVQVSSSSSKKLKRSLPTLAD